MERKSPGVTYFRHIDKANRLHFSVKIIVTLAPVHRPTLNYRQNELRAVVGYN